MADTEAPVNTLGPQGFIRDWLLLGPFPSERIKNPAGDVIGRTGFNTDFLANLGGESNAIITPESTLKFKTESGARKTVKAYPFHSFESGHLSDRSLDGNVGYAFCYVESDQDQKTYVYFGSDGSPKVWINGTLVFSNFREQHATTPWEYGALVDLKKGRNSVLVKLDNDRGWWGFQTEWYRPVDHAKGFAHDFKGLKLRSLTDGKTIKVIVDAVPKPLDLTVPVNVELQAPDKQIVAKGSGKTGDVIELARSTPMQGVVTVRMISTDGAPKIVEAHDSWYLGDFSGEMASLAKRLDNARNAVGALPPEWRPVYEPPILFLDGFLATNINRPDNSDIANLLYARDLISALEQHENYIASHLGDQIPAAYPRLPVPPGSQTHNTYLIQLPKEFIPGKAVYPLSIFLHGSGGIGQKASYKAIENPKSDFSAAGVPYISVHPLSGKTYWHIDALNRMLVQIKADYSIDADRVYLAGHSMGGTATWVWAMKNPELFAAIEPMAGYGNPLLAPRLAHVPVIAFQGDQDTSVLPFHIERTISALRAAGGEVLYTLDPKAGHTINTGGVDVIRFFNKHTRNGIIPADPVKALQMKEGVSSAVVKQLPQQTCLAITTRAIPEELSDETDGKQPLLFDLQRQGGHLAAGNVIQRIVSQPDEDGVQTFDLLLPIDRTIAAKGDVRIETLPAVNAYCFYASGSWKELNAQIAEARRAAAAQGLKMDGEIRRVLLGEDEYRDERDIYEIQLILAK